MWLLWGLAVLAADVQPAPDELSATPAPAVQDDALVVASPAVRGKIVLDRKRVATVGEDGLAVWDVEAGSHRLLDDRAFVAGPWTDAARRRLVALSAAHELVVVGLDGKVLGTTEVHAGAVAGFLGEDVVYADGDLVRRWTLGSEDRKRLTTLPSSAAALATQRGVVAVGRVDGGVTLWRPKGVVQFDSDFLSVDLLSFSPDGTSLAVSTGPKTRVLGIDGAAAKPVSGPKPDRWWSRWVVPWAVSTGKPMPDLSRLKVRNDWKQLDFDEAGQRAFVVESTGRLITLDLPQAQLVSVLGGVVPRTSAAAIVGDTLISGTEGGWVGFWRLPELSLRGFTRVPTDATPTFNAFPATGQVLVKLGRNQAELWSVKQLERHTAAGVEIGPALKPDIVVDGLRPRSQTLLTANPDWFVTADLDDGSLRLWSVADAAEVAAIWLLPHGHWIVWKDQQVRRSSTEPPLRRNAEVSDLPTVTVSPRLPDRREPDPEEPEGDVPAEETSPIAAFLSDPAALVAGLAFLFVVLIAVAFATRRF